MLFFGAGAVFGTSGEGSTSIGMSGMFSSGRALGLGAAVADDDGNGGSCANISRARKTVAVARSSGSLIDTRN
jgi:hypothetical protein